MVYLEMLVFKRKFSVFQNRMMASSNWKNDQKSTLEIAPDIATDMATEITLKIALEIATELVPEIAPEMIR